MDVVQILKLATLAYVTGVGVWFGTAQAKFSRDSKVRPMLFLMMASSLAAAASTIISTLVKAIPLENVLVTLLTTTAAVFLIKWAFRSIRQRNLGLAFSGIVPGEVVQHGPYRHVRHPLYLAYSIFWAGCAVISASLLTAAFAVLIIILYISAARAEERDLMGSDIGATYQSYRKRTGLILPRFF